MELSEIMTSDDKYQIESESMKFSEKECKPSVDNCQEISKSPQNYSKKEFETMVSCQQVICQDKMESPHNCQIPRESSQERCQIGCESPSYNSQEGSKPSQNKCQRESESQKDNCQIEYESPQENYEKEFESSEHNFQTKCGSPKNTCQKESEPQQVLCQNECGTRQGNYQIECETRKENCQKKCEMPNNNRPKESEILQKGHTEDVVVKGNTSLQFIAAFSATVAYLIGGTFLGWPSPTIPLLLRGEAPVNATSAESAWVAAFPALGMLFAPLAAGVAADALGRKTVLSATGIPFLTAWLMIALAKSVAMLYAARFIAGLALGVAFTVGPMYTGEIAEDRIRGAVGTLFQVMINLGTLFEYGLGPYVTYVHLAVASMVFPLLLLSTCVWMPESPYYLLRKGHRDAAERALLRLRGRSRPEVVHKELDAIQLTVDLQAKERGSLRDLMGSKGNLKALLIVLGLMMTQHFSGIIPLLSFVTVIFINTGSTIDANVSAIIFAVVQLVVSVVSSVLVDRTGRRPLLLLSTTGCAFALAMEGLYFFLSQNHEKSPHIDWIPITCLLLYIIAYTLGLGPLPWAIAGEVFPSNVKGLAMAIVSMVNAVGGFVITKLFQVISDQNGDFLAFWIFSGCCIVGTVFIALFVPETKGKSLLQIGEEMNVESSTSLKRKKGEKLSDKNQNMIATS